MNKYIKYTLVLLVMFVLGCILSYFMNESVLICDIYVMLCALLYQDFTRK